MNHPGVPQHRLDTEAFGGAELFDLFADPSGIPKKNEDRGRPGIWRTWFESVSSQGWSFSVHVFEKEGTYRNTNGKFEFCLLFSDVWKMLLLTDPIP